MDKSREYLLILLKELNTNQVISFKKQYHSCDLDADFIYIVKKMSDKDVEIAIEKCYNTAIRNIDIKQAILLGKYEESNI